MYYVCSYVLVLCFIYENEQAYIIWDENRGMDILISTDFLYSFLLAHKITLKLQYNHNLWVYLPFSKPSTRNPQQPPPHLLATEH